MVSLPNVIFSQQTKTLDIFLNDYVAHEKGLFIVAPSGAGKTHFVKNQVKNDWIDGDKLWVATGAHPNMPWWTMGLDVINEVDQRSDVITSQARRLGYWIIGASNYWLIPDGIVLPDWEIHKRYIINREQNNYDGGAKSSDFDQVMNHRKYLESYASKNAIPVYDSIEQAVIELTS